jgi:hypothetical protein
MVKRNNIFEKWKNLWIMLVFKLVQTGYKEQPEAA